MFWCYYLFSRFIFTLIYHFWLVIILILLSLGEEKIKAWASLDIFILSCGILLVISIGLDYSFELLSVQVLCSVDTLSFVLLVHLLLFFLLLRFYLGSTSLVANLAKFK